MRWEGYEFTVSKAEVLYHNDEKGHKLEPMEQVYIDVLEISLKSWDRERANWSI